MDLLSYCSTITTLATLTYIEVNTLAFHKVFTFATNPAHRDFPAVKAQTSSKFGEFGTSRQCGLHGIVEVLRTNQDVLCGRVMQRVYDRCPDWLARV